MDRSKLADLSEILSSIAIVVTLVYLAIEIRQNTNALYAQSRQSVLTAAQTELFVTVEHPELLLDVVQEEPLTPAEQVKIWACLAAAMRAREFSLLQYRDGIIDAAQWQSEVLIIRWTLGTPRTQDWWQNTGRFNANPEFVDFVDQEMRNNPPTRDSWRLETNWARH